VPICSSCACELTATAKFCPECGTAVAARACPACGTPADHGRFCAECGAAIDAGAGRPTATATTPATGPVSERRVTSVLFGDLVGFTTLSENRDPEEVRELLSRYFAECRTVIGRYGGTVEKFIGDAVMAVWGVPVAHEDDAERAVRAGLELVETVTAMGDDVGAPGLAMRVGVVTGEVAVTVGATAEGMVAGDAVNTASRVQATARPGQVWVDDTTRSLTLAAIAYQDAGEHSVKGKAEPLQLFVARSVVAEVGGGQRVDGLEAPLTGRERELRLLKELFHSTQESLRPRLVVVDGDPGVGKSRLVWEFEKYADGLTATIRWHRGRCLSYGEGVAFWALAEALRPRLGLSESDTADVVSARLDAALVEFVPDPGERDWLRPRVAALLGAGGSGGSTREELFTAWATFVERLSEGGNVVVLVIDDAQYADDGMLDFLDHLLSAARAPVFVLALARPELLARRPQLGGRRTTVVRLDPLDDTAMATLVDGLVVGLRDDARDALVARSEGVPLYAVETVRALIDRDAVVPRGGQYVPADGVELDLAAVGAPATLQALVAARLDALTPAERRVVADASVLGASFTREGLVAVGSDTADLDGTLAELQRKEIIAVQLDRFSAERGQYRFVQSVVRQVAYGTLSRRDRRTRHVAAADHLESLPDPGDDLAIVVAQHLLDAVDASSDGDDPGLLPRACALLERAGVRARALGSPAEARRLFEAALARSTDPLDRARLHLAAGEAAGDAGDYRGGADHAAEAVALYDGLDRPIDAGYAASIQCRVLIVLAEFATVVEIAQPRWDALEGLPGAQRALMRLSGSLANALFEVDRDAVADIVRLLDRRLYLAEQVGDPFELCMALLQRGSWYQTTGAPSTARALYESCVRIAREQDLPMPLTNGLMNLGTILMSRDLPAALDTFREALAVARRTGIRGQIDYTAGNYATTLWAAGLLAETRELVSELGDRVVTPTSRWGFACVDAWLSDATGRPVSPPPAVESSGAEWDLAAAGNLAVLERSLAGDAAGAAGLAEGALGHTLKAMGIDDDFMHFWPPLLRAALAAGDIELAERLLAPVSTALPGIVSPAVRAHLLNLRGLVGAARGDDAAQVEDDLRAGLRALAEFGAVGWSARAEEDLGRWLLAQGRAGDSAVHLEQARATYAEIGAHGWLAQLDVRLAASSLTG
jgi:class 3 adenylate cyclase/tetratricopeptide (TPR) repeat protein